MSDSDSAAVHQWPPIFWLPPELILMITKLLPISDTICLGITCRHMYHKVDRQLWDIARATKVYDEGLGKRYFAAGLDSARWDIFTRLEGQLPNLELCHFCRIFHPRVSDRSEALLRPIDVESSGFECDAKDFAIGRWSKWGPGFKDVQAVMTRHYFGECYGLPLSHLHYSTDWTFSSFYKKLYSAPRAPFKEFLSYFKFDADAIIDNDQLLVHRTQRLWLPMHDQGTGVLLRYGVGDIANDMKICSHHTIRSSDMIRRFVIPFGNALKLIVAAEDIRGPRTQPQDLFQRPLLARCRECPTQFQTSFHVPKHDHGNKSIEFVIDVWQNLGSCRSPEDPGWISCWGRLNPRYRNKDSRWTEEWNNSNIHHLSQSQRDSFRSKAGASAAADPSSSVAVGHWDSLSQTVSSVLSGPTTPVVSVRSWEPLMPTQFDSLLRSVESAMANC